MFYLAQVGFEILYNMDPAGSYENKSRSIKSINCIFFFNLSFVMKLKLFLCNRTFFIYNFPSGLKLSKFVILKL